MNDIIDTLEDLISTVSDFENLLRISGRIYWQRSKTVSSCQKSLSSCGRQRSNEQNRQT